jgi:transposase-like protein
MKPITTFTNQHSSQYAAAKAIGVHPEQLRRWVKNDAHVNDRGEIFIKTKGRIEL